MLPKHPAPILCKRFRIQGVFHVISEKIANVVIHQRWWVVLATLILVGFIASGAQRIEFSSNYRAFFAEGNEQLQAFEALQNTYVKADNVLIVMDPQHTDDVFQKDVLRAAMEVTERAWQLPWSTRVDSVTNFQHTRVEGDDLFVDDLVPDLESLSAGELSRIRDIALNEHMLRNRLVSDSGHVIAVSATIQMPELSLDEVPQVTQAARELADEMRAKYPNIDFYLTGAVMLNNAFSESSQVDMQTLMPIMFGIILVTLALLLRSVSGTLATLVVIVLSIVTAMGLFGWIGWTLTPPSSSAPTIIMTMAVADCVHLLVTFLHSMRQGHSKEAAMRESIRLNLQPIFITSVTTVLGFMSMNFSEVPPFRDLGNTVAMGVIAAFVFSITFLPALMMLLPVKVAQQSEADHRVMSRIAEFVIAHRNLCLVGSVLLTIGLFFGIPQNRLNDQFVEYFGKDMAFRQDTDFTAENLSGIYSISYSLSSGEQNGISDPAYLQDVLAFTDWLREQPEVQHVFTVTDIFKRLNKNMHGDDPKWYRLPEQQDLASQYLLLYELSLPFGLDLTNQIDISKSATRLVATTPHLNSWETLALEERSMQWLADNTQLDSAIAASPNLMFSHIGFRNVSSMVTGTLLALGLISMILVLALRSPKLGVISLAPNLIPAGIAFGLWGFFNGNVGISLGSAIGMTLGIVVDDSVHFLSKYRRARKEKGLSAEDAVRYAFNTVGVALWVTTFVLVAGFMVLALSDFKMNAHMGVFTALTISIALVLDFLLLPAMLLWLDGGRQTQPQTTPGEGLENMEAVSGKATP